MSINGRYENQLFILRQYGLLVDKGMTSEQALKQIESTIGKGNSYLEWLRNLLDPENSENPLKSVAGPAKSYAQLLRVVTKAGGNKSQLFKSFYQKFLKDSEIQYINNFDTSGLLVYLIVLLAVIGIVASIYIIFVFPGMEDLYSEMGEGLPQFSNMVFQFFNVMGVPLFILLMSTLGFFLYAISKTKKTLKNLDFFNQPFLSIPGISVLMKSYNDYIYLNFTKILIEVGIKAQQAVEVIENEVLPIHVKNRSGFFSSSDSAFNVLDIALTLGNISEEIDYQITRKRDAGIEQYARAKETIGTVAMISVAVIIGNLVIAMYLPIFQMGKVIGG